MEFTIRVTGTRPLIMHNGRLANPLDDYTRQLKSVTKKRSKTDDDLAMIARLEARAGLYETTDGLVGMPNQNLWRCVYDAAKAYKLGEDIKRSLIGDDAVVPLMIDGETISADEFFDRVPDGLFYASVKVQRVRTMRARPIVRGKWTSVHTFELLDDVVDEHTLAPVLARAGRLVGLGDWRPTYGTFTCEVA